jgi:hypothetical protein
MVSTSWHGAGMKLLTATRQGQGERPGDFFFAVDGELVVVADACATDQADPDGGCGCGRAFSGVSSLRATTTALVRELDISYDDLQQAVESHFVAAGYSPDLLGAEDFADLVDTTAQEAVKFGSCWPVGTLVGRRVDSVYRRA